MVDGLEFLHSKNIYHRDIKPDNIFLFNNMCVKLGDLGLSIQKKSTNKSGISAYAAAYSQYGDYEKFEN